MALVAQYCLRLPETLNFVSFYVRELITTLASAYLAPTEVKAYQIQSSKFLGYYAETSVLQRAPEHTDSALFLCMQLFNVVYPILSQAQRVKEDSRTDHSAADLITQ